MWPPERTKDFSKLWTSDLVFDRKWPIFEHIPDLSEAKILAKFQEYPKHKQGKLMK